MIEIKGKVNTAICYATVVEGEAIEQIRRMCDHDFTAGSQIRIMPDVHAGKGCTIGTTMTITDKVVPNIVGVDIGCGMYTAELGKVDVDFEKVDAAAHDIPSGRDVWEGRMERFDLTGLRCYRNLKQAKRLERSLGTLGGGNHFIEIDAASDGTKYLVIHSGSRNLGKQVAELYQSLAIDLNAGKADYFERRDELIRTYKEQGRRAEIQTALKAMEKEWAAKEPTIPADLCYLYGTYLEDYLHDVEICQQFARRSRERMAEIILEKTGMTAISSFHTIHNYLCTFNEVADTNVEAVFDLILDAAVRNNVPQEELPETLYLISDMEFNACVRNASVSNFASAKRRFAEHGYRLPQIVFWNVASRNSNQPVTKNEQGVALVSGCTPRLFSMVASGDLSPYSVMMEIIESERYAKISA